MSAAGPHKVLLLTRYDRLGPSSRVRFLQFLPELRTQGFDFDVRPFFDDEYILAMFSGRKISIKYIVRSYWRRFVVLMQRRRYDLIWLEKEALPWLPTWIEGRLLRGIPYVVDFDDAWFHRYDLQPSRLLRAMLGGKIDAVMRRASMVVAGNKYLADRAHQAGARRIVLAPSTIDLSRYPPSSSLHQDRVQEGRPTVIGWVGTPMTAPYLAAIEPAIRAVSAEAPIILRIVGAEAPAAFAGLRTESVAWSEATEIPLILGMDIGIMPLANTLWERGKCAYKLLQIMAAGRPVVASAVGANCEVVQHGTNGFLAVSTQEWITALLDLIRDPPLRRHLGITARDTVERDYSQKKVAPLLASVLRDAISNGHVHDTGAKGKPANVRHV